MNLSLKQCNLPLKERKSHRNLQGHSTENVYLVEPRQPHNTWFVYIFVALHLQFCYILFLSCRFLSRIIIGIEVVFVSVYMLFYLLPYALTVNVRVNL